MKKKILKIDFLKIGDKIKKKCRKQSLRLLKNYKLMKVGQDAVKEGERHPRFKAVSGEIVSSEKMVKLKKQGIQALKQRTGRLRILKVKNRVMILRVIRQWVKWFSCQRSE